MTENNTNQLSESNNTNEKYSEYDDSLFDCVKAFKRSIDNLKPSFELQELFFKFSSKRNKFPETANLQIVDQFIYCIQFVASSDPNANICRHALEILFQYLKNDVVVFERFKPNKLLLRKLKFEQYLINNLQENKEDIFDFICFLLRYYQHLDYEDFSDIDIIKQKIRRAEMHRSWIDVEDMVMKFTDLEKEFRKNQNLTTSSIGEIFSYCDKIKTDKDSSKENLQKQVNDLIDQQKILKEKVEKYEKYEKNGVTFEDIIKMQKENARLREDVSHLNNNCEEIFQQKASKIEAVFDSRLKVIEDILTKNLSKIANQETQLSFEAEKLKKIQKEMQQVTHESLIQANRIKLQQELVEDTRKGFLSRVARLESELVASKSKQRIID